MKGSYPRTPDGRYFVVRGRLWRLADPSLPEPVREQWVAHLMTARRAVRELAADPERLAVARAEVNRAKIALGERGPVWWRDGAPDFNRRRVIETPYASWFASLAS
jgi:hypothetical protein